MKPYFLSLFLSIVFLSCSTMHSQTVTQQNIDERPLAFPGAEGFGRYTTGGRGGKIYIVTNLHDRGPGSFRRGAEDNEKRIIVFAVSGTIHLETKLYIKGDVTIAGQSAPGDGICLADNSVGLGGDNIIIRFLRFRLGDKYQRGGMVDGNGGDDAFGGVRRKNIIIDHCSMSWSTDEVFSIYAGDSTTVQWNIISEPLNYSYHFEAGDKDYEHHGFGGIWGGRHSSFHHNLFAHCSNRTPRFDGIRNAPEENCDYRNNVIYNWGGNNVYAGEGGTYNIVNNYYKPGPSTSKNAKARIVNPYNKLPSIPFGKFYVDGNYVEGATEVTTNNWLGVSMNNGTTDDAKKAKLESPFSIVAVKTSPAIDAYAAVLKNSGALFPKRDTLDERIINDVKAGTGKFIDVQGGFPHGTPYELTVNAWPALNEIPPPTDTDKDGMPDEWEKKNGLDPNNPADAAAYSAGKQYTNIEVFLNSLIK